MNDKMLAQIDDLLLKLNEEQLHQLNRKIAERIKLIHRAKSAVSMSQYNLGNRVYFIQNHSKQFGVVVRLNPRSITVKLDNGQEWRITPDLLSKVVEK